MEIYENMKKMSEGGIHETQWQNVYTYFTRMKYAVFHNSINYTFIF